MNLQTVSALFLIFSISFSAFAKQVEVTFSERPLALNIKTNICLYGGQSKASFNKYQAQLIKNEIVLNRLTLSERLSEVKNTTAALALHIVLGAAYQANTLTLESDFRKVGNELCNSGSGQLPLPSATSVASIIPFPSQSVYHWLTTPADYNQKVFEALQKRDWPINEKLIIKSTSSITSLSSSSGSQANQLTYFTFNTALYQSLLNDQFKSIYLETDDAFKKTIESYFSEHGFTLHDQPENAFWSLAVSISPSKNNMLVEVVARKKNEATTRSENKTFNNTAFVDTGINQGVNTDKKGQQKLLLVYLTLMDMANNLAFKTVN